MANENENIVDTTTTDTPDYQEYIDTINELKRNSVSRTEYDKLMEEKKTLLSNLVNGTGTYVAEEPPAKRETLDEMRKRVFDNPRNDLEYVSGILEIRTRVMEEGGADPFVSENSHYTPTQDDYRDAELLANGLAHCVEVADGDNSIFLQELSRITKDTPIVPKPKTIKRR